MRNFIAANIYYSNHITNKAASYLKSSTVLLFVWLTLVSFDIKTQALHTAGISLICSGLLISGAILTSILALYENQESRNQFEALIDEEGKDGASARADALSLFKKDRRARELWADISLVFLALSPLCFVGYAAELSFWNDLKFEVTFSNVAPLVVFVLALMISGAWLFIKRPKPEVATSAEHQIPTHDGKRGSTPAVTYVPDHQGNNRIVSVTAGSEEPESSDAAIGQVSEQLRSDS